MKRIPVILALALAGFQACAGLGDNIHSKMAKSMAVTAAPVNPAAAAAWSSRTKDLPGGGRCIEYINGSGYVFAVSWNSIEMPDVKEMFGASAAIFEEIQQRKREAGARSMRRLGFDDGELIFSSEGHLRAFHGFAAIKSLAPEGFDFTELAR